MIGDQTDLFFFQTIGSRLIYGDIRLAVECTSILFHWNCFGRAIHTLYLGNKFNWLGSFAPVRFLLCLCCHKRHRRTLVTTMNLLPLSTSLRCDPHLFVKSFKRSMISIPWFDNRRLPLSTISSSIQDRSEWLASPWYVADNLAIHSTYRLIMLQHGFVILAVVIF